MEEQRPFETPDDSTPSGAEHPFEPSETDDTTRVEDSPDREERPAGERGGDSVGT